MSLKVTYDQNLDSIVIKVLNTLGCREILLLRDQIVAHPKFRQNISQLFDCSEGDLDLTTEDIERIASHYILVADTLGQRRKLALVVRSDLNFGQVRQYEGYFYSGPDVHVRAFRSLLDAKEWLIKK